ncbi:outer membrane protein assembly factor BamD [Nitrogeniibacter mangrovi]|uniref:Outer membrane protein assembly factor BamD n=1 Tax=Nitrogeniibacter mangrovi TaxID=2016596 RepID=A0A6C1B709_9RHOO|nr:outer membrane protein assembly factor BamD [Nitrogeniibacter mangrovi]QID18080.1 outer membrane protein assembly factor BamD [Nitrogeniibacter mangrovi]
MAKYILRSLAAIATVLLVGCSSTPSEYDETAGWSAQRIYSEAKDELTAGGYERAISLFEKLEARYPYGRYAQQAQLDVAYAYFKSSEQASAIAACDRFIKLHPNHPNVDYAYYLKGLIYFNEDQGLLGNLAAQDLSERDPKSSQLAFDTFRELVTRFPESRYSEDATQRLHYLFNSLAAYQVHVARYYYKRGAFLASANRAQDTLTNYPGAPATEEALFLLTEAYDALGMTQLRDDAHRVLQKTFPKSAYLSGDVEVATPWWQFW